MSHGGFQTGLGVYQFWVCFVSRSLSWCPFQTLSEKWANQPEAFREGALLDWVNQAAFAWVVLPDQDTFKTRVPQEQLPLQLKRSLAAPEMGIKILGPQKNNSMLPFRSPFPNLNNGNTNQPHFWLSPRRLLLHLPSLVA